MNCLRIFPSFGKRNIQANCEKQETLVGSSTWHEKQGNFPPPPGATVILPEYIHYYGYYYQVIVQC
jgi:hypothetical protein